MAKKNKLPLLGALAATPVMTASVAQAQTFDVRPAAAIAGVAAVAQAAALKLQLLTLNPGEKLSIAGDRLGGEPLTPASGRLSGDGRTGRSASRVSIDCTVKVKSSAVSASCAAKPMVRGKLLPTASAACGASRSPQMKRPTGASAATCPGMVKGTQSQAPCGAGAAKARATYCSGVGSRKVQAGQVDRRLTPTSSAGKCAAKPLVKGAGKGSAPKGALTNVNRPLVNGAPK